MLPVASFLVHATEQLTRALLRKKGTRGTVFVQPALSMEHPVSAAPYLKHQDPIDDFRDVLEGVYENRLRVEF